MFIGADIVEISRIRKAALRFPQFWARILTPGETAYCQGKKNGIPSLAGRFAAKEAILKCLGLGLAHLSWHDMEILPDENGCPQVSFSAVLQKVMKVRGIKKIKVSISHSRNYAMAVAIGEGLENEDSNGRGNEQA